MVERSTGKYDIMIPEWKQNIENNQIIGEVDLMPQVPVEYYKFNPIPLIVDIYKETDKTVEESVNTYYDSFEEGIDDFEADEEIREVTMKIVNERVLDNESQSK